MLIEHDSDNPLNQLKSKLLSNMYRLFNVLCWLWNIHEGAKLPSVYFINNTKHCITCLALTQLFPVLMTSRFHIVKYTHTVAFCCILLGVCHFLLSHGCVHMGQMDFISSICFRFFLSKLSAKHIADHTLQCIC